MKPLDDPNENILSKKNIGLHRKNEVFSSKNISTDEQLNRRCTLERQNEINLSQFLTQASCLSSLQSYKYIITHDLYR